MESLQWHSKIRRAALSVNLKISRGCFMNLLAERKNFFDIARASVIKIEAGFDIVLHGLSCLTFF